MASRPSSPRVRHVRADEHDRLRALRLQALSSDPAAFTATYARDVGQPPEWWHRWAAQSDAGDQQRTFVLVDAEDRWLGLALARRDADRPAAAVINAMWVAPEARGGGARALCDACAAWAAERGLDEITLTVLADNANARRAYEAAGFAVQGRTTWSRHDRTLDEFINDRPAGDRREPDRPELLMVRPLRP
jgi:RimJ/RimL family protein N-acetyltransferase